MIIIYICVLCRCTQLCSGCILILLVKLSQGVINGSLLANTKLLHWRRGRNDLTMASAHGTLSQFDLSTGDWKFYVKRAKLYLAANDIASAEKQRAIFLSCGDATAELLLGRRPRSWLDLLKPSLADNVQSKMDTQKKNHDATVRMRAFAVSDNVCVKDFPNAKKWMPGRVIEVRGPLSYLI